MVTIDDDSEISKRGSISGSDLSRESRELFQTYWGTENKGVIMEKEVDSLDVNLFARKKDFYRQILH